MVISQSGPSEKVYFQVTWRAGCLHCQCSIEQIQGCDVIRLNCEVSLFTTDRVYLHLQLVPIFNYFCVFHEITRGDKHSCVLKSTEEQHDFVIGLKAGFCILLTGVCRIMQDDRLLALSNEWLTGQSM